MTAEKKVSYSWKTLHDVKILCWLTSEEPCSLPRTSALTKGSNWQAVCKADNFTLWLICSDCPEDPQSVPAPVSAHRDATTQLITKNWFFLALVGNVDNWLGQTSRPSHADPANASLWISASKVIGQVSAPAGPFCFGTSLSVGKRQLGAMYWGNALSHTAASTHSLVLCSQPKPRWAQEQEQSVLHGTGTAAVCLGWLDQAQSFQSWKAAHWHHRHNKASTPLRHRDAIFVACRTH